MRLAVVVVALLAHAWTGRSLGLSQPDLPCIREPVRGFGLVFASQDEASMLLGCPAADEVSLNVAVQRFEGGWMVWEDKHSATPASVYVLFDDDQHYARFDDTYSATGEPLSGPLIPPPGLLQPTAGFGKVWRAGTTAGVRPRLGWATSAETSGQGAVQAFQRGQMVWTPEPQRVWVLAASSADRPPQVLQVWRAYADAFVE